MNFLWWRSWHGAPVDLKYQVIAARSGVKTGVVSAIVWALMDYASQHKIRGTVTGFDTETYSAYSGFSEAEIQAVIKAMTDKEMIVDGKFANWEKRQPKREDDSTNRVRDFREKKRNETQGNAEGEDVTFYSPLLLSESSSLNSLSDSSLNEENEQFDLLQRVCESKGIIVVGPADIEGIYGLIKKGVTVSDLECGIAWKIANNHGKAVSRISQVTGPTLTAMSIRLNEKSNGGSGKPIFAEEY